MSDFDDLLKNFVSAAAQDINPLLAQARADMDLNERDAGKLAFYFSIAWRDGAMAGQSEMIAQAIEQGANVDFEMVRAPTEDEPQK